MMWVLYFMFNNRNIDFIIITNTILSSKILVNRREEGLSSGIGKKRTKYYFANCLETIVNIL